MNEAIKFLTRERDVLNRRINQLNQQEESLNSELKETTTEKVNAIHARNDINEALNKLTHGDSLSDQSNAIDNQDEFGSICGLTVELNGAIIAKGINCK